ncbi:MAG: response regulator [Candidatus Rokubacteria bacterium]|nr:response regulator [Candidatus Rokubacteria bacterium]
MKRRLTLLIVDDETRISDLLTEWLESTYTIVTAADGETALARVGRDTPDLMLLDINLPGVSGLEVLKRVRELRPDLPVIMITATTAHFEITAALMRGAFGYLPKPFTLAYVEHMLAAATEQRSL